MSPATTSSGSRVEILLVPFRHGECPSAHPDLQSLLRAGWTIRRTDLRLVEGGQLKHLVVLHRPVTDTGPLAPRPSLPPPPARPPHPSPTVSGGTTAT